METLAADHLLVTRCELAGDQGHRLPFHELIGETQLFHVNKVV